VVQQSTGAAWIGVAGLYLWILRSVLIVHCFWLRSGWLDVVAETASILRILGSRTSRCRFSLWGYPVGQSEMPFVPLGTLLVHDKTRLAILSEVDTDSWRSGVYYRCRK
jgi:hypothetical protein